MLKRGQIVGLRADPSRRGPIIEILPPIGGVQRYRVFHSPLDIREYREDQLIQVELPIEPSSLREAIEEKKWLTVDEFRARLTAARLAHPQVDNLYALHSARIQYIPFQFKPLMRLLRSDQPRLLIADEVGVGKTIEAGLILKELQTRQRLDNVLIVCPKALVPKWREEMRRFDEDFRPLTAESLQYCLHEAHLDGGWPSQYARAIAHLELLRIEKYMTGTTGKKTRPGILTLDPPPRFSLVIVDEAHHLRNPETNSHELAKFLCDVSEAVLFLSATPVHVGSQNLFSLLHLLRPELFPEMSVFDEVIEPNRYIFEAMRSVRLRVPADRWQEAAASSLEAASQTNWGRSVLGLDPRFSEWHEKLNNQAVNTDADRVRCLRDLEEVHTLAHIMNRTRRRDIGRFTIREPHTVTVHFTETQQVFYAQLIEFRRQMLLTEHDSTVMRLITDTLERQAASCLPALVPAIDTFIRTGRFSAQKISDDPEFEGLLESVPAYLLDAAQHLREIAYNLPSEDPKFAQLLDVINTTLQENGPKKVLVFSYFLHTLAYLKNELAKNGLRVALITGQVKDEDRENLRRRFRLPWENEDAIDVLLSSDVGCEGLDYEFCDQLVNYDIPWNPMRIEQRIGRIDRFGQASAKIFIFNFITPGTVEERIFFRCFERLGVFRDAVGDLEEILGELTANLNQIALDPQLSPTQAEEMARQMADNAIRLIEEERRLEEEGGILLGMDEAFIQEVDELVRDKRFVSPTDLRLMVEKYVEDPNLGGRITPDEGSPGIFRLRLRKESRDITYDALKRENRSDRPTIAFMRWLQGNDPHYLFTFDQKIALERREIPFVTPVHPLARVALRYWSEKTDPLVSSLHVVDQIFDPGTYLFICELWETIGVKPEIKLVSFAWDIKQERSAPDIADAIIRLLSKAVQAKTEMELSIEILNRILDRIDEESNSARLVALGELQKRNEILIARKLASLETYYQNRMRRVQLDIQNAQDERIIRMKVSERDRISRDFQRKREDIESKRNSDIITKRVAAGILEVSYGE